MTHIITLSLLILTVILIRAAFRRHVSPVLIYSLWLVVLLKLCMPFSLFEMTLPSFFGTSEVVVAPGNSEKSPEQGGIELGQPSGDVVSPSVSTEEVQNNIETLPGISDVDTAGEVTPIFPQPSIPSVDPDIPGLSVDPVDKPADTSRPALPKIGLLGLAKIVWGVGSLAVAAAFSVSGTCFYLKIRRDRKLIGRAKKTKIYLSESVGAPSLVGLFRPAIYLTPDALKNESRAFIILHEATHLRHGDHIWSIIRIFALIAFWWNPLVWAAAILSKQDAELACDHSVLSRIGEKRRFDYARVIIDMLPRRRAALVGLASGSVKERVKMMTEKHKNRILAAVLAFVLVISAVGCSFIGGKKAQADDTGDDTGEISSVKLDPDEYFTVIENASDLEFEAVPFPIGEARSIRYPLGENCWVYMSYEQYGDGEKNYEVRFHVFDVGKGSFVSSRPFYTEDCIPSTISYTKNGCILFDSRIERNDPISYTVQCGFEIVYKDGELSAKEREHEMFPMCERYITSPDGKYSLLKMTYDGYNGGGIEVITPDGMFSPLINIMLDDEIDGRKAGIQDVRGYTPVGFIDDTKFLYTIGGWEWSIGYGIYDLATDEKKEYLEGHGIIDIEEDGSFYVCEAQDYEYKNIWKTDADGKFELIATRVVDGISDAFPLYGSNVDWTHQDNAWYAYDLEYSIVRPDSDEKSKVSVYPIDFSEKMTTFEARTADLNNGLYLYGDKLYMIVRIDESKREELSEKDVNEVIETLINKLTRKAVQYYPIDCTVYLDNDPEELKTLIEYGDDTLTYLYNIFNHNINISPEHGVIMQEILIRMLGDEAIEYDTDQPYEYFNYWRKDVVLRSQALGDEKMKKDYPKSQLLIEFLRELFLPDSFSEHFPNSRAITKFYHKIFASDIYIYFCEDYKNPKEYYIYYTSDYGKTIGAISAEIPSEVEYDSAKPIYVGGGGGSGECEFVFELTNGGETFYVRFDNFSYTDVNDWLKFEYRGEVGATYVGERLGVNYEKSGMARFTKDVAWEKGMRRIDLLYYDELGRTVISKSAEAVAGYPDNELYAWHIEQVFDNGSVLIYVGSELNSYNKWYLVDVLSGTVTDIFKDVPKDVIENAFYVHCTADASGTVFWCNKGEKAYYFDCASGKCTDVAGLTGLEGATHAYNVGAGKLFVTAFSYEQSKIIEGGCYDLESGEFGKFIEDGKVIWTQLDTEDLICFEQNTKYGLIRLNSEYAFINLHNGDFNWSKTDIDVGDLKLPFGDGHFVSVSSAHYGDKIYVSLYRTDYGVLLNEITIDLSGLTDRSYSTYEDNGAKYLLIKYTDSDGKSDKRLVYIG